MENALALFAAATALMASPGPATLGAAAFGAAYRGRAFPYVVGLSLGTATVMVLVATGVTGLVTAIPGARPVIAAAAGAYILWLAWKIANAAPLGALDAANLPPPFLAGYALSLVNPKAYGAMGALFSGFELVPSDPVAGSLLKFSLLAPYALVLNTTWMFAGSALAGAMRTPRTSRILNVTFAVLLVAAVVVALAV